MGPTILTLEQAAARIGRSVETMRHWRKRGEGPRTFRMGRRVVLAEEDLNDWINAQRDATQAGGDAA